MVVIIPGILPVSVSHTDKNSKIVPQDFVFFFSGVYNKGRKTGMT